MKSISKLLIIVTILSFFSLFIGQDIQAQSVFEKQYPHLVNGLKVFSDNYKDSNDKSKLKSDETIAVVIGFTADNRKTFLYFITKEGTRFSIKASTRKDDLRLYRHGNYPNKEYDVFIIPKNKLVEEGGIKFSKTKRIGSFSIVWGKNGSAISYNTSTEISNR